VSAAFKVVRDTGATLDVLVNNAGVGGGKPIDQTDTASWRESWTRTSGARFS
jgi:NADP-dependent 3-hydroxy acid dehydrogenase YdfG